MRKRIMSNFDPIDKKSAESIVDPKNITSKIKSSYKSISLGESAYGINVQPKPS